MLKHLVPETKMAATCSCVMANSVIGVGDPVGGGRNINIKGRAGWFYEHSQIVSNDVPCLDTIFHEISVSCVKKKQTDFNKRKEKQIKQIIDGTLRLP